jgi:hypothetical protein
MPSAKAPYDKNVIWKYRQFSDADWLEMTQRLQTKLTPLYPVIATTSEIEEAKRAWVVRLQSEAYSAISTVLWHTRRRTNEELRAECNDLLGVLNKAADCLSTLSPDLDRLLGVDVDVLGARDKILKLIPPIQASEALIAKLPRAKKIRDAQHDAAIEMAISCLRVVKEYGGAVSVTLVPEFEKISPAIQILKILGDELDLELSESTWKKAVARAKKTDKAL